MNTFSRILPQRLWFNASRNRLDEFAARSGRSVPAGAMVLDAGSGIGPYRHHFSHARYESADFGKTGSYTPTYVCDLRAVPVENDRYDLILLSQVLEHVPEPLVVLKELHRILKPGGQLWLSAPLFFEEHQQPYDFYRYTQFAYRYLLDEAGFAIKELEWLEGYFGTLAHQLEMASRELPLSPRHYGKGVIGLLTAIWAIPLRPVCFVSSLILCRAELRNRYTGGGHCKNYAVVAIK